jgi:phytoene/squalene synthetase
MGDAGEDRTGEAVAHLQGAARELIAALRAFLDVAEEVVDDPQAGEALLDTLGDVARRVVPRSSPEDDGGVEHIAVD